MSNHSQDHDTQMNRKLVDFFNRMEVHRPELLKKFERLGTPLGAPRGYPEGKLTEQDEGAIRLAIFHKEGKVILDFGSPVKWMGITGNQAIDLGKALIKHAKNLRKGIGNAPSDPEE